MREEKLVTSKLDRKINQFLKCLDKVNVVKQVLVAKGMDVKAHIEQLNKINDDRFKEIKNLKRENEELCRSQNKTKAEVEVNVTNQLNMWNEENKKDKVNFQ